MSRIKESPGVTFHSEPSKKYFSNNWLTCIVIDPKKSGVDSKKLTQVLGDSNIEARPLWKPMHLQPVFEKYLVYDNKVSSELFNKGLCLPSGSNLKNIDLERISAVLRKELKL